MPSTTGRRVVEYLTNKSGGAVANGDVVIIDTSNNESFTTTTTAGYAGMVGVAQEAIANNAAGRVLTAGYAALVTPNASVTRGNFGKTHTVAKQATDAGSSRVAGVFCQFLTSGTTPTAHLFGMPDGSGSGSSLNWTADVNQSGASFASFAANSGDGGTWSSNGTEIIQTNTSATVRRASLSAQTPLGWPTIIQADVQVVSTPGSNGRVGIGITDGTSAGFGEIAYIDSVTDTLVAELDSNIALATISVTINTVTFYTLRIVYNSYWMSLYLDGVFKGNVMMNVGTTVGAGGAPRNSAIGTYFLSLISYNASVKFKNIKAWSLSTGAP